MENKLFAYFDVNPTVAYPVILGNTYTKNFNEQIDSMTVVLDNVEEANKLNLDGPYHWVKIINKGTDGFCWKRKVIDTETGLVSYVEEDYIFMLVNSWTERKKNLVDGIYVYQINLMNIIKLFEKIECPNRVITHSLVYGNKTIWECIDEYMKLYCPKVPITYNNTTWTYEYLFDWSQLNTTPFNDTPCADLQFNNPTLRELLTTLMSQVACIPTVYYRTLSFINFRDKPETFTVTNSINDILISGASDSYANTLVVSPNQILDSDNEVISENIGFRDKDKIFIRQNDNLKLETKFPIYKIYQASVTWSQSSISYRPYNQDNDAVGTPMIATNLYSGTTNQKSAMWNQKLFIGSNVVHYWSYDSNGNTGQIAADTPFFTYPSEDNTLEYITMSFVFKGGERISVYDEVHDEDEDVWIIHKGKIKNIKVHYCLFDGTKYTEIGVNDTEDLEWTLNHNDTSSNKYVDISTVHYNQELINVTRSGTWYKPYFRDESSRVHKEAGDLGERFDGSVGSEFGYTYFISFRVPNEVSTALRSSTNYNKLYVWFEDEFYDSYEQKTYYQFVPMRYIDLAHQMSNPSYNSAYVKMATQYGQKNTFAANLSYGSASGQFYENVPLIVDEGHFPSLVDLTPIFVENSKRQLLKTNYKQMPNASSIEQIAEWIYGTVGYSIGSKEISGFSQTYSKAQGWWSKTYNYFDNVVRLIGMHGLDGAAAINLIDENIINTFETKFAMPVNNQTMGSSRYWTIDNNKSHYIFTIRYQPLNTFKMKFHKQNREIPIPITQANFGDSGLGVFERYTKYCQDTINRVGNPVLNIVQTTDDLGYVQEVNSVYDNKYTIFQAEIQLKENYVKVKYTGSENYVMQNYFTSITQKYRAYEYVNYEQSVVRKENTTVYCLLSPNYYPKCEEHIWWRNNRTPYVLLNGLKSTIEEKRQIRTELEYAYDDNDQLITTKNEVSIVTYPNGFALIYECYDNVSAGTYIVDASLAGNAKDEMDETKDYPGLVQKWQIWSESYNIGHEITFASTIYGNLIETSELTDQAAMLPIVTTDYSEYIWFDVVDDQNSTQYTFYKDNAEVINHTIQFDFWTTEDDIIWGENFMRANNIVNRLNFRPNTVLNVITNITSDDFVIRDEYDLATSQRYAISNTITDYVVVNTETIDSVVVPYIIVEWSAISPAYNQIILAYVDGNGVAHDFIGFKRPSGNARFQNKKYYLSLQSVKTTKALYPIPSGDNEGIFSYVPLLSLTRN